MNDYPVNEEFADVPQYGLNQALLYQWLTTELVLSGPEQWFEIVIDVEINGKARDLQFRYRADEGSALEQYTPGEAVLFGNLMIEARAMMHLAGLDWRRCRFTISAKGRYDYEWKYTGEFFNASGERVRKIFGNASKKWRPDAGLSTRPDDD